MLSVSPLGSPTGTGGSVLWLGSYPVTYVPEIATKRDETGRNVVDSLTENIVERKTDSAHGFIY